MTIHEPIREIARFYASRLGDADALRIVDAGTIQDESEGRAGEHLRRREDVSGPARLGLGQRLRPPDRGLTDGGPFQETDPSCVGRRGLDALALLA